MNSTQRTKFVREVDTETDELTVKKPFKVERDEKRRFIRLEISSPMSMKRIKDTTGGYWPQGENRVIEGTILNISAGGVLVDLQEMVEEGDVVAMHFTLQEVETLDDVLGLVKRVDPDAEAVTAGIQFITRDYLSDLFSQAEMDLLPKRYGNFDDSVRQVLNRYFEREIVSNDA
jgi:hypothetical protein